MATNVFFLTLEQVLLIHNLQIEKYGGSHGIRDLSLLESAIFRPQSSFGGLDLYPTLFDKAAVLMDSIIKNHAFVDGNKRTGTGCVYMFLSMNGYELLATKKEFMGVVLGVARGEIDLKILTGWLRAHSVKGL